MSNTSEAIKAANDVTEQEEWNNLYQLFDNVKVVRRVFYTTGKDRNATEKAIVNQIGTEHTKLVKIILQHVAETDYFYESGNDEVQTAKEQD
jgi:hypothetical protein